MWFNVLEELTNNYNNRPSRALAPAGKHLAPAQIGAKEEKILRADDLARADAVRTLIDAKEFPPGTLVRLLHSRTKEGSKASWAKKANDISFTREAYQIVGRAGPNSYLVDTPAQEAKVWPHWALQKAVGTASAKTSGPKVNREVVSAKRLEARNISEDEQAAALASPSRPKREVKKPLRLDL